MLAIVISDTIERHAKIYPWWKCESAQELWVVIKDCVVKEILLTIIYLKFIIIHV